MTREAPIADQLPASARLGQSADPRAVRTRLALERALFALLETHDFAAITPRQIAGGAGVSRAAFYLHYASSEAMFDQLVRRRIIELQTLAQAALDAMGSRVAALALCEHVETDRRFWATLFNGGASAMVRAEFLRHAQAVAALRAFPDDRLPADLATAYSTSGMLEVLAWWLRQPAGAHSAEEVADLLVGLVFNAISAVSTSPCLKFR